MKVVLGVSNRHLHLNEEDYKVLFGDSEINKVKDLVQPGEFASDKKVMIKTEKNSIDNVRLIGPIRKYTQVEISKTDSYFLGLNPPIKTSGELDDAVEITIVGPSGEVKKNCCIIANRHIHITKEYREKYDLIGVDKVAVASNSEKNTIFDDVYLKESENYALELHLDTDDANGALLKTGDYLIILKK